MMISSANDPRYLAEQYHNSTNLDARLQLHARFSTNKYGWHLWVFDHLLELSSQGCLLELGCGPGYLWQDNRHRIPGSWRITLSDFSPGMLQQARENLHQVAHDFAFEVTDAQAIPFDDETFDAVIANHMLYHVADRARAFSEIRRALKPGGRFFASTVGEYHLREISELIMRFDADMALWAATDPFTLENGQNQIENWFAEVTLDRYDDALLVDDPKLLAAYILSAPSIPKDRHEEFTHFIEEEMRTQPVFRITKDSGLFTAAQRDTAK